MTRLGSGCVLPLTVVAAKRFECRLDPFHGRGSAPIKGKIIFTNHCDYGILTFNLGTGPKALSVFVLYDLEVDYYEKVGLPGLRLCA